MNKVFIVINNDVEIPALERFLTTLSEEISVMSGVVGIQTLTEDTGISFIDSFPTKLKNKIVSINLSNKVLNGFSFAYGDALKKLRELNSKLELEQKDLGQVPREQREVYEIISEVHNVYLFDFNCISSEEVEKAIKADPKDKFDYIVFAINNSDISCKNASVEHIDISKPITESTKRSIRKYFKNESERMG